MTVVKLSDKVKPVSHFDDFWKHYPRRVAKGVARTAFQRACKIASPEEIILGAIRFADFCKSEGTEMKYIPHASTWLNGERWEDELHSTTSNWGDWDEL